MREMKDSGIEWIGEIPSSWQILRVKDLFNITRGRVISVLDLDEDGEYPVYSSQTENNGCFGYLKSYDYSKPAITWTTDGAKAGTVFYREGKYNCTNVCGILQPKIKILNLPFLTYAIACVAAENKRYDINGYKIMSNEMANIHFAYPSSSEQKKIADFLDKKCSEIDSLYADIQTQIETLEEYKKSVITEAVTKGLDPNVEMKDSGVEWIEKIPINWKISHVKFVADFYNGDRSKNYPSGGDIVDIGIYFLTANNIHDLEVDVSCENSKFITPEKYSRLGGAKIKVNDLIFCLRGSGVGNCAINKSLHCGTVASSLVAIRPKKIIPTYLNYIMNSPIATIQTKGLMNGSCAANLSVENVARYYFTEPPIVEQHKIADFLDQKCSEIDQTISEKKQQLETLAEYKKSLIYECVTGKKEIA